MPQFTRYTQLDEAPAVPDGWLYVDYDGAKIKIVDAAGNSMAPYSRALVDGTDLMVQSLIAKGTLKVISEATVSLDNYVETVTMEPVVEDSKMDALKQLVKSSVSDSADVGDAPVQATAEAISQKDEYVKKNRKKKSVDTEAPENKIVPDDPSTEESSETTTSDTATPDEQPSV